MASSDKPQAPIFDAKLMEQWSAMWSTFNPERMSHLYAQTAQAMGQYDPTTAIRQMLSQQKSASNPFDSVLPLLQGANVRIAPEALAKLQTEYLQEWARLMANASAPETWMAQLTEVAKGDRRFSSAAWSEGAFPLATAAYLLNSKYLTRMGELLEGDTKARARAQFSIQQVIDASAPSNFLATNPEAIKRIIETQGESLRQGIENLVGDLQKGRISQSDESAFEVGKNVATSEGAVVFENDLFQLIQYKALTPEVGERPLLMVPPCINKFYIMDLQPDNSLVRHAVENGNTVFLVSWKNIDASQGDLTWDDYIERGAILATKVVQSISKKPTMNVLGFCVGGTIVSTALAVLAARGEQPAESLTLLTSLLDFEDTGILDVFVDEMHVQMRESTIGRGGIMPGKDLAATFSFLRPNDLVWNYVVNNYLKGERPAAFDLLFWNGDSTNLPGPMYAWYLRNMYLENNLRVPDKLVVAGARVDLRRIDCPTYVFAAREDHIVPWTAAYRSAQTLGSWGDDQQLRFVLGASGHIAGTINSAKKNKRSFWVNPSLADECNAWLDQSEEKKGSWWSDWTDWLKSHQGAAVKPPRALGSAQYKIIEPAPGRYVKQRAE